MKIFSHFVVGEKSEPRSRKPLVDSVPPGPVQIESPPNDDGPSVFFALLIGSGSVMFGFWMIRLLAKQTTPALASWVIARGTGLALVVVTTMLVAVGLWMAHPLRNKKKSLLHPITLDAMHKSLAFAGMILLFLHISAIISDRYANVGIIGAFVPLKSHYRTFAVALGTVGLYLVAVIGLSAWLKVRFKHFNWKMIHRYAILCYFIVLCHGILAGTDTLAIGSIYLLSLLSISFLTVTRYLKEPTKPGPISQSRVPEQVSKPFQK